MRLFAEPKRLTIERRPAGGTWLLRFLRAKPLGGAGLVILAIVVFIAVFAPLLVPYDPESTNPRLPMVRPNSQQLFGTDTLGRDVFSRTLYGSRISLFVGLAVVAVSCTVGSALGVVSAYVGGALDLSVQRLVDAIFAFPSLILAMALMTVLGPSLSNVVIALAIVATPNAARTVRSAALSVRANSYVEAAEAIGASKVRIMVRHILPNCMAPILIIATIILGQAIVSESSLSFLGVGVPPYVPTWGSMISGDNRTYALTAPWMALFPGIALSLTVLAINLLGDALRDVLDPRLRGTTRG